MLSNLQIGERIGEVRKGRAMSQQDLAEGVDVSRQYISEIETGKVACSLDVFQAIAKFLGTSLTKLLDIRVPEHYDDPRHQEVHQRLQNILELDPEIGDYTAHIIEAILRRARISRRKKPRPVK